MDITNSQSFQNEVFTFIKENIINLSAEELEVYYRHWNNSKELPQTVSSTLIPSCFEVPTTAKVSLDLPYWVFNPESSMRIMVIGRNPENPLGNTGAVSLKPPLKVLQDSNRYFEMITRNASMYITNLFKYNIHTQQSNNNAVRQPNQERYIELLNKEITLFKPDLIFTMHSDTFMLLTRRSIYSMDSLSYKGIPISSITPYNTFIVGPPIFTGPSFDYWMDAIKEKKLPRKESKWIRLLRWLVNNYT